MSDPLDLLIGNALPVALQIRGGIGDHVLGSTIMDGYRDAMLGSVGAFRAGASSVPRRSVPCHRPHPPQPVRARRNFRNRF
ncbi:MAG: hypothetical protein WDN72_05920 [Alphaproteobacteria bacterium]